MRPAEVDLLDRRPDQGPRGPRLGAQGRASSELVQMMVDNDLAEQRALSGR